MKIRCIDAGRVSSLRSQSIYHGLGKSFNKDSPNTLIFSIPDNPYICVGHFQNPKNELDLDYCRQNQLPVIRRQTGGGAVFIDSGQIFVQWVFNPDYTPQKVEHKFRQFIEPMVETYKFFGINAYDYGGHDVLVDGKKIVGTGAARIGEADVITGNFILDFDSRHLAKALNLPNECMRQLVKNGMGDMITSMSRELPEIPSPEEIKSIYLQKFNSILGVDVEMGSLNDDELKSIDEMDRKLSDPSWTFALSQPEKNCRLIKIHTGLWIGHTRFQMDNGSIELTMQMEENRISFIKIDTSERENKEICVNLENFLLNKELKVEILEPIITSMVSIDTEERIISGKQFLDGIMTIYKEKKKISGG